MALPAHVAATLASISPLTYAVAALTLLAATLYVTVDWARTYDQLDRRTALVERFSAVMPMARQVVSKTLQPMLGDTDPATIGIGIAQRGAIAYGLALALTGAAFRRRRGTAPAGPRFTELLSTIPFGVACWNADGALVTCNEQYGARLDVAAAELRPGASYAALVRRLIRGGYTQLISEDEASRVLEVHREDGSCLMIDERPLDAGGFVTLVTDVTEMRRADHLLTSIREEQRALARRYHEEKLKAEAASRSKSYFLAHLSHDIRTPLNHIIGFAELMRQQTYGPLGDPRYDGYIESIRSSGERLLSFFASILDLAELEGGRRALQVETLGVDPLLRRLTQRYSSQAQRAHITLSLGAPCGAALTGDQFLLERMLGNLVDNALRFTPAGGSIKLSAYAAEDGVVLDVSDTGSGISPEQLAMLSQPFAFGDAALTRDREGAGLGLAIARAIAELSGGHLAIDSRLGLGTTVAISLPAKTARPAQIDAAA